MDNHKKIDRLEAIKRTGLLMGGVIFAPTIAGILKGCTPSGTPSGASFSQSRLNQITTLADLMLPATSTPGALDAGVPTFIERMVTEVYSPEDRKTFMDKMDAFMLGSNTEFGAAFMELTDDNKIAYMKEQTKVALETYSPAPPFILIFKELCLTGFCLSEAGSNSVLRYMQTPGKYEPCLPFEEVGKTWAI